MSSSAATPLDAARRAVLRDTLSLPADCVARLVRFEGRVEPERLRHAVAGSLAERPGLYATFRASGEAGRLRPAGAGPAPVVEVLDLGPEEPDGWLAAELVRPLDLVGGPLVRHVLIREPGGALAWFLRHHRLVDDDAGLAAVVRRAAELYADGGDPLPPKAENRLAENRPADRAYWQEVVAGLSAPEPAAARPAGALAPPADLPWLPVAGPAALARVARAGGAGPGAVLLGAAAVAAHRLTGVPELLLGHWLEAPGPGGRGLVVPVRLAVTPELTFTEVVRRAGRALRGARRHGHRPDLDLPWSAASGYGLVTGLADSAERVAFGAEAVAVLARAWGEPVDGRFLRADPAPGAWRVAVGGHGADAAEHRRIVRLLERLAARPDEPVHSFDVAGPDELAVVGKANATDRAVPETTVPEAFAAQLARTPDAVAVRGRGAVLDYAALDERSERIARRLAGLGVGREDVVAVLLPRTPTLVAAVLGVLKAGAAYLPVDPGHPQGRVAFLLADTRPRAVLTTAELAAALPAPTADGPTVVLLDDEGTQNGTFAEAAPARPLPGNAAYVIHTSGSTGTPKGVVVTHRAVANLAAWAAAELGPEAFSRVLGATSLSFDLSVFELLVPLFVGGSVDLVDNLLALLERPDWSGSLVNTVPSVYQQVARAEWVRERAQTYVFAGEPLPAALVRLVHARNPQARVLNLYGPTEAVVYATAGACPPGVPGEPSIGVPVGNVRAHVLDPALRPAPLGVAGELYLAGDYLARGYAHRPGATAVRFLPDPFGTPGARMYRTGDLARWSAAGELEYLGRTDHQVKVRGHRIELGEIEARLTALAGVRQAVVVATDDGEGDRRTTAFLVADERHPADPEGVRAALRAELPAPVVPAALVFLDALPTNTSGKTDRTALAALAAAPETRSETRAVAGSTRTEVLRELFAGVLGLPDVGPDDSFFVLGGDSIRSIKLLRRARRAGLALAPEDVFAHPTPAGLAAVATPLNPAAPGRPAEGELLPLDAAERAWLQARFPGHRDVLPLTPLQERLLFSPHGHGGGDAYVMRLWMDLDGRLDPVALRGAVEAFCRRHPNLSAGFVRLPGGRPVQVVPDRLPPFTEVDLSGLAPAEQEAETERLAAEDRTTRFDPADPPLIRFTLLRLGPERYRLVLVAHHTLIDGWSNQLLLPELFTLYRDPAGLAEPVPLRDHLAWLAGRDHEAARRAWREALAEPLEPTLVVPAGLPPATGWPGRRHRLLGGPRTERLGALAARLGVTLNTVLQATWALMLAERTGRPDVVFGIIVSGRSPELPGSESVMGFLINTLPLRITLREDESLAGLLTRVQREQARMIAHQHLGIPEIQRATGLGEIFDTVMVYENFPQSGDQSDALPGVRISASGSETAAHYPLTLMAIPRDGGLELDVLHREDVVDVEGADALLARALELLDTLTAEPGTAVGALGLLSPWPAAAGPAPARTADPAPARTADPAEAADGPEPMLAPLLALRSTGTGAPLFCVHAAAGIGWTYGALLGPLGDRPLYALQSRGLDGRGPLPASVEEVAEDCLREIRAVQPEGPYHLLGWSFGGLVAYAVATRLQEQGAEVGLLALLDSYVLADLPARTATEVLEEQGQVRSALLRLAGVDRPADAPAPTAEEFLALAGKSESPLSVFSERHLTALAEVYDNNVRLGRAYRPGRFHGDLLLIEAVPETSGPVQDPESWLPYLGGRLLRHRTDHGHQDLGGPAALVDLAPALLDRLGDPAGPRGPERN
ncbi:amino acid adenylation domain-containing protein [Kitasatospora sp. MAA19]|uniref:non-ribosomal peptide synthetase n=1 Tax=Kitasatospora sp. MAA19 TaxID=3035090 RepID=UPI002473766E|nr:non-ribosomal peptide synthetase [Kitasatospora sp. MAA19]MDH6709589.1 amino acid adenylation domain-containing protein [Kitasatospora sp. MAA19]